MPYMQEKYENAMSSLTEMEKKVKVAESMLEATLQYESGQAKALSPRYMKFLFFGMLYSPSCCICSFIIPFTV